MCLVCIQAHVYEKEGKALFRYFYYRMMRKKSMYTAFAAGIVLSVLYIVTNVLPYADYRYHQSPYTLWIGSFNSSVFAELFFLLMPILAAMPAADIYLTDRKSGYLDNIISRGRKKSYFCCLFITNYAAGAMCFIIPAVINIICSFCILPDIHPDIIVNESSVVTMYGTETLFPELYYTHPLAHMALYLVTGSVIVGMYASLALASGFFIKNRFVVWLSVFIIYYIYMAVVVALMHGNANLYLPASYMREINGGGSIIAFAVIVLSGMCMSAAGYIWGVRKHADI